MAETIAPETQARHWMLERRLAVWFAAVMAGTGAAGLAALAVAAEVSGTGARALLLVGALVATPLLVLVLTVVHARRQSGVDEDLDAADD